MILYISENAAKRVCYLLAKIGADTAENERHVAEICQNLTPTLRVHYPTGRDTTQRLVTGVNLAHLPSSRRDGATLKSLLPKGGVRVFERLQVRSRCNILLINHQLSFVPFQKEKERTEAGNVCGCSYGYSEIFNAFKSLAEAAGKQGGLVVSDVTVFHL